MLKGSPNAPAVDAYLKDSFEVIRMVHDNLPAIRAIAGHLTPVEDLIEFQNEVSLLYSRLALLVEASQIIIQITDAGYELMTADNVAEQRMLLELGSAALKNVNFFAKKTDFDALKEMVNDISDDVDSILAQIPNFIGRTEFDQIIAEIQARLVELGTLENIRDIIDNIEFTLPDGTEVVGVSSALLALYSRVTALDGGINASAGRVTLLENKVEDAEGKLLAQASINESLTTSVTETAQYTEIIAQDQTALKARLDDVDSGNFAEGSALETLKTSVFQNANGIEIIGQSQLQLESRLDDAETGMESQATALEQLTTTVTENAQGVVIVGERVDEVTASLSGVGNLLAGSSFEADLGDWVIQSRGAGWVTGEIVRDADNGNGVPVGMSALRVNVTGTPTGALCVRSPNIPVEELEAYIASAYMASINSTLRLEWRSFTRQGAENGAGVIDQVTNQNGDYTIAGWRRSFKRFAVNNGVAYIRLYFWVQDPTGNPTAWLLRPMVEQALPMQETPSPWVESAAGLDSKFASATSTLRSQITEIDGRVDVLAESITDVIANSIDEARLAQATEILQANIDAEGNIRASAITEVKASQTGSGNLVPNADFGLGLDGWDELWNSINAPIYRAITQNPQPSFYLQAAAGWPSGTGGTLLYTSMPFPVEVGKEYMASLRAGSSTYARIGLGFYGTDGLLISGSEGYSDPITGFTGETLTAAGYGSGVHRATAPAGAKTCRAILLTAFEQPNQFTIFTRPQVEQVRDGQTVPSPWAPGAAGIGSVTQDLQVGLDATTGRLNATYGIAVDVNGKAIGFRLANDGAVGRLDFIGDAVSFQSAPGSNTGIDFTPGNTINRQYGPNWQRITSAVPFGADNLTFYFGPNVGVAGANKANATRWEDANGNAYYKGAIIAGSIRNGGYSSSTNSDVTFNTGQFGSIGQPIQVNASWAYNQQQVANAFSANFTAGAGTTRGTIQLWRALGNGPLELVAAEEFIGSMTIQNESDGPSTLRYAASGAITYVDNAGGTQNRTFEIRLINRENQQFSVSGSVNTITTSQATGVTTAEN